MEAELGFDVALAVEKYLDGKNAPAGHSVNYALLVKQDPKGWRVPGVPMPSIQDLRDSAVSPDEPHDEARRKARKALKGIDIDGAKNIADLKVILRQVVKAIGHD